MELAPKFKVLGLILTTSFAALMIGLAIWGGYQLYSPVPFWDMWGGGVNFFLKISDGNTAQWWAQHNEHRILLTRLLFWVDFQWLGGSSLFLIIVNYLLVGLSALLFWRIIRAISGTEKPTVGEICFGLIIIGWLFLWSQSVNLTSAFQSQFFLAQLLPLCALYWLNKATNTHNKYSQYHFMIACVFGVASVVAMANGVLALPLMVFYAILTSQGKTRISGLIVLTIITSGFYFYGYHSVNGHGSIQQALKNNPLGLFNYILMYLGSPFYFLFKNKVLTWFAGLVLIAYSIVVATQLVRKLTKASLKLALLLFIFYIEATAFCTGGGRSIFGLDQALSSRYTTPAIMAWAALLIIHLPSILHRIQDKKYGYSIYGFLVVILSISMLRLQFTALQSNNVILFERKIAALALQLGVNDSMKIKKIYPDTQSALSIAKKASAKELSVFGVYPFSEAKHLGERIDYSALLTCQGGGLTSIDKINDDKRFVAIKGWINSKGHPQMIRFLNQENKVVGYALTENTNTRISYEGYLLTNQAEKELLLQGDSTSCQMYLNRLTDKSNNLQVSVAKKCIGVIDIINEAPVSASFVANQSLSIRGWLAKSVKPIAELPDSVLLVLTDNNGKNTFIKTRQTPRPDVGAHFKNLILDASGYTATADVSSLYGNYTLGIAYTEGNNIKICPQFKIAGVFKKSLA